MAIERNKREIQKAFEICPVSVIVFVFGNNGGRIRSEDCVAFEALAKAYELKHKSLCFVVNDLPDNVPENYEAKTILSLKKLFKMEENPRVCFIKRLHSKNMEATAPVREQLMSVVVQCEALFHKKHCEIELQAEQIAKYKEEVQKRQEEITKLQETMQKEISQLQRQLDEEKAKPRIVEEHHHHHHHHKSGGCSIM
mmetsp:Transcript_14986/g.20961  ORF Transcript_14986/g.20961 Transcript_14986/m.20961 type:complete len:197 (+) Transcript_14986:227-817(+)